MDRVIKPSASLPSQFVYANPWDIFVSPLSQSIAEEEITYNVAYRPGILTGKCPCACFSPNITRTAASSAGREYSYVQRHVLSWGNACKSYGLCVAMTIMCRPDDTRHLTSSACCAS